MTPSRFLASSALVAGLLIIGFSSVAVPSRDACTLTVNPGADLQKAVDGLRENGGAATLCLDEGEFPLDSFLRIDRDDFTLRGRGRSTVLRLREGATSPVVVIGDFEHAVPERPIRNVTVESLRVVGGGPRGSEFYSALSYLTNSAVVVRAGRNVAIRGLEVSACRSACILTEYGTERIAIEYNDVSGSVWDGISLNRTYRARIAGNVVRGNTAAGITVEHLEDSTIEDNVLTDNKTHGIYLSDSYRNAIRKNRFAGNVLSGVFITCAVRDRGPVRCWDDSMSSANAFEWNEFSGNRTGYQIAADGAANCARSGFVPNLSRGDLFAGNPNEEPDWAAFGRCLLYAEPRSG